MASSRYYKKKKRSKRRDSTVRVSKKVYIIAAAVIVAVAVLLILLLGRGSAVRTKYLASNSGGIAYSYYDKNEHRLIKSSNTLRRGLEVIDTEQDYVENGISYRIVKYEGNTYYVDPSSLTDDWDDIIRETKVWVKTPAVIYKSKNSQEIISQAEKGDCLTIMGFDEVQDNGYIHRYKIRFVDSAGEKIIGWVSGKYVVSSESEALTVNTEVYDLHKDRVYADLDLKGGVPSSLDWFPVDKPSFSKNILNENISAMYISVKALDRIEQYIRLAATSGVNTIVIDIKDEEQLAYRCEDIMELSAVSYRKAYNRTAEEYKAAVQKCIDAGFYCIGRIVTFKDANFCVDNPDDAIITDVTNTVYPSPYSRKCWYYNITLARSAAELCGFNEIMFDYVMFPAESYYMSNDPDTDFRNKYDEEKAEALQRFLYYSCDALHELGVYVSSTVYGESVNKYITAFGQYYPAFSLVVDAICAISYTDDYGRTQDTWSDPYETLISWAERAAARQSETPNPAVSRTFITAYDVPQWDPVVICDDTYVSNEAQALVDGGLTGGFIAYNKDSDLDKYTLISPAWGKTYSR